MYIVRHGRTALNAQGRFRGLLDVPLDGMGLAQAGAVAEMLRTRPITRVAHSPLLRARQTAAPIAHGLRIDPEPHLGLLDLDVGVWSGLNPQEAEDRDPDPFRRYKHDPLSAIPPGGEPLMNVEQRILSAIDEMGGGRPGSEVVAVTHEVPIRLLLSRLLGISGAGMWDIALPTGSVTTLAGSPTRWRMMGEPNLPGV